MSARTPELSRRKSRSSLSMKQHGFKHSLQPLPISLRDQDANTILELNSEISRLRTREDYLGCQLKQVGNSYQRVLRQQRQATQKVDLLSVQVRDKEAEIQSVTKELQASAQRFSAELSSLSDDCDLLGIQNSSLRSKLRDVENQLGAANGKCQHLMDINDQLKIEILNTGLLCQTGRLAKQNQSQSDQSQPSFRQVVELRDMVECLQKELESKNQLLKQLSPVFQDTKIPTGFQSDQEVSVLNSVHFMGKQLQKRLQTYLEAKLICERHASISRLNREFTDQLRHDIRQLQKRNDELLRTIQTPVGRLQELEQSAAYSKQQIQELLWQNQACHLLLLEHCGKTFFEQIEKKKNALRKEHWELQEDSTQMLSNQFVTVTELIQKNGQLVQALRSVILYQNPGNG